MVNSPGFRSRLAAASPYVDTSSPEEGKGYQKGELVEERVSKHPDVQLDDSDSAFFALSQSFALVRHAERLDRSAEWETFPDRDTWPNDTPLTSDGHEHARQVGQSLKDTGKPFGLIISSPYLRCAQTASRIAQVLNLPIQFDLDLGEVFDSSAMVGNIVGPQHRGPAKLEAELRHDFKDVSWVRGNNNEISIEGKQQKSAESLDAARMRFCLKVQQLLQGAASKLMSIVIVTHGDALAAVIGMLREDSRIQRVPYTSFAVGSRQVKVLEKGSMAIKSDEPVYESPTQWTLQFSEGLEIQEVHPCSRHRAHAVRQHKLKKMRSQESEFDTPYLLDDDDSPDENEQPVSHFQQILQDLGADEIVSPKLARKACFSSHLTSDCDTRIICSPQSKQSQEHGRKRVEERVKEHPHVSCAEEAGTQPTFYALSQCYAIVRHADRLDRTSDWQNYPDRDVWPNDTPLTQAGHEHASQTGRLLKETGKPFGLIISSPYLRCAQTASRIAEVLDLPIQFDLDLGEVFDRTSLRGDVKGPQHRSPSQLESQLEQDFPDVSWMRNRKNEIKIQGQQQRFPESLDTARMRFCFKVQQLLQRAAAKLMSIVIVTHGDAVGAVLGMMRAHWKIQQVPYASFALGCRQVKVLEQGCMAIKSDEPVYEQPQEWTLELSDGLKIQEVAPTSKKRAIAMHGYALKKMDAQEGDIETLYLLPDEDENEAENVFMGVLSDLGVDDPGSPRLAKCASRSRHFTRDRKSRMRTVSEDLFWDALKDSSMNEVYSPKLPKLPTVWSDSFSPYGSERSEAGFEMSGLEGLAQ